MYDLDGHLSLFQQVGPRLHLHVRKGGGESQAAAGRLALARHLATAQETQVKRRHSQTYSPFELLAFSNFEYQLSGVPGYKNKKNLSVGKLCCLYLSLY